MNAAAGQLTVFAQGMRRSGTTVLYDLLLECGDFACFYEPLAAGKRAPGGGSGLHGERDLFEPLRRAREAFLAEQPQWLQRYPDFRDLNRFNHGAPRDAALEFEPTLPDYLRAYLGFLCRAAPRSFLKFTRMHSRAAVLKEIEPRAKFIHIVRDPRRVAASYLFGRDGRNRGRFSGPDVFFGRVSQATAWSSRPFSDHILGLPGYGVDGPVEDFLRVLLIWKYKFEQTHRAAQAAFGANYLLFRHDALLAEPAATLARLGEFLGIQLPRRVLDWAAAKLRAPEPAYAADDARWTRAFRRLDMLPALQAAGYVDIMTGAGA